MLAVPPHTHTHTHRQPPPAAAAAAPPSATSSSRSHHRRRRRRRRRRGELVPPGGRMWVTGLSSPVARSLARVLPSPLPEAFPTNCPAERTTTKDQGKRGGGGPKSPEGVIPRRGETDVGNFRRGTRRYGGRYRGSFRRLSAPPRSDRSPPPYRTSLIVARERYFAFVANLYERGVINRSPSRIKRASTV